MLHSARLDPADPIRFPYMVFAQGEGQRSSYCLSQSGMPPPDASFLEGVAIDLQPPFVEALPRFEARVAELFGVRPERVLATLGASAAMHFCALRWFRAGSRVVCERPSYDPLRALPELLGAETVVLRRRREHAWDLDPGEVERALAGAARGHVFLANPHNPSGTLLEATRVRELAAVCERAGGNLVSCEVYGEFLPPRARVHAALLAPNGVSIGSLTKAYGLGPLRLGWILLGEGLVAERHHVRDMAFLSYVDPPTVALRAGLRALDRLEELLQPLRRIEHESRPLLAAWLAETEGVQATFAEHGIIAFPELEGVEDTLEFARYLADRHEVDVVPGEYFGVRRHVRVGCGVPAETLREGLARLGEGLSRWRAGERSA